MIKGQIYELIREKHQKGFKKETAFSSLCYKLKYTPHPATKTIEKWFTMVYCVGDLKYKLKIKEYFLDLLKKINFYYSVLDRAVLTNGYYCKSNYLWTNPRYRLDLEDRIYSLIGEKYITFYDAFHDKALSIPITNGLVPCLEMYEMLRIQPITRDRFIFYQNFHDENVKKCQFDLLSIDFDSQECQIIKEVKLKITVDLIVSDKSEPGKFILLRHYKDGVEPETHIYCGQLKEDEILIKSKVAAKIRYFENDFYELNGIKLYGIRFKNDNSGKKKASYWEIELNKGSEEERTMLEFEFTFDTQHTDINLGSLAWFNEKCYMVGFSQLDDTEYLSYIVCFDTQTQKCSILKGFFFKLYNSSSNLCVDNSGVLYVQGCNIIYRLPLREPESFQNLCWFAIRRQTIFTDDNLYQKAKELLPYTSELRPFCFKT